MFEAFVWAREAYAAAELQQLLKPVALPGGARVALTTGQPVTGSYDLIIVTAAEPTPYDRGLRTTKLGPCQVEGPVVPAPLAISQGLALAGEGEPLLTAGDQVVGLALPQQPEGPQVIRLGFNLVAEVGAALGEGLPPEQGQAPVVDQLLECLQRLIDRAGKPWARVPPRPWGHPYLLVLSHDIDHTSVREHWFDRTLLGVIYRCGPLSLWQWLTGRRRLGSLLENWWFLLKLPLMLLGLVKDGWAVIADYVGLEAAHGARSTYYFIPRSTWPGVGLAGARAPGTRAAKYELEDLRPLLAQLVEQGFEVGLHGLDAWLGTAEAAAEGERVAQVVGRPVAGLRMHWLYLKPGSLQAFDAAGFAYDASWGYNTHAGYRAGTAQVYQPPGCRHLLEVPLHIQDGALLSEQHLHLKPQVAQRRCDEILQHARAQGGIVSVLWHDCALVPPRGWADLYRYLLAQGKADGAWLTTCEAAADWFRARRELKVAVSADGTARAAGPVAVEHPFTLQVRLPAGAEPAVREIPLPIDQPSLLTWRDVNGDATAD